jgi:hypothetical protein
MNYIYIYYRTTRIKVEHTDELFAKRTMLIVNLLFEFTGTCIEFID